MTHRSLQQWIGPGFQERAGNSPVGVREGETHGSPAERCGPIHIHLRVRENSLEARVLAVLRCHVHEWRPAVVVRVVHIEPQVEQLGDRRDLLLFNHREEERLRFVVLCGEDRGLLRHAFQKRIDAMSLA